MRERERPAATPAPGPGSENEGSRLRQLGDEGDDYLNHMNQALDRARSGDSEAFMVSNQQTAAQ